NFHAYSLDHANSPRARRSAVVKRCCTSSSSPDRDRNKADLCLVSSSDWLDVVLDRRSRCWLDFVVQCSDADGLSRLDRLSGDFAVSVFTDLVDLALVSATVSVERKIPAISIAGGYRCPVLIVVYSI
ncbi:hypothetical protein U1Q18_050362, partial [Sarracenia purpurea var. burkii]